MGRGLTHEARRNATDEWYTPPVVFTEILCGLTFDLDPCSPGAEKVPHIPASRHLTASSNGLSAGWGGGSTWLNPPYSEAPKWVRRMVDHCAAGGTGVCLTFARTDSRWAQMLLKSAERVLFLSKRVAFLRPDGTSPGQPGAGSMLCAWGSLECHTLEVAARNGHGVLR